MKILLIDQLSPVGHINYDEFWVKALQDLNIEFEFIASNKLINELKIEQKNIKLIIPKNYYEKINNNNFFIREFYLLKILFYIKNNIDIKDYENIVFLSFENFSMFFAYFFHKKNVLLILHNNLRRINQKIIYHIIKYLSKKVKLISLDFNINKNLNKMGIKNELIIHPQKEIKQKDNIEKNKKQILIFSPSVSSLSKKILSEILQNKKLHLILQNKNIKLILRDKKMKSSLENIIILDGFLSKEDYLNILKKADVIFLPYKEDFNNRISGVLLEAIYLNKSLIIPKYNDLKNFLEFNKKGIVGFNNIEELQNIFLRIENLLDKNDYKEIKDIYSLNRMKKNILGVIQ
ncbi:glycosyltransferase (plasmid) [Fusobacterium sp. SB021]|uniref:glycosyltransferase n=1 Tax=Fusobacterium sp. SB021 TaxID=2744227 RepID=UPI003CF6E578